MHSFDNVLKAWDDIDSFLAKSNYKGNKYFYAYSIRNLYAASVELNQKPTSAKELFILVLKALKWMLVAFFTDVYLTNVSKSILFNIKSSNDSYIPKKMELPVATVAIKTQLSLKNVTNICYVYDCVCVAISMLCSQHLDKSLIIKIFPSMVYGAHVYNKIKLDGVEKIITQNDRYPTDLAVLKKAKDMGIKTIKVDYFPIIGFFTQNTIFCEYYFYPNSLSYTIFKSFPQNADVKFVEGGFPDWDNLDNYTYKPLQSPSIITFFTHYGQEIGYTGDRGCFFYIEEILSVMPFDSVLYIKIHPLDKAKNYEKYIAGNVKIVKHGEIDNWELVSQSTFCFSIYSFATFQAKHICNNSYYLNYDPHLVKDFEYDRVTDFIDLIKDKETLERVLNGNVTPKNHEKFIKFFNISYPYTIETLRDFIDSI